MSLEDRYAIQELCNYYATYIDIGEVEKWADLFTVDAYFDERKADSGLFVGRDEILAFARMAHEMMAHMVHLVSNLTITNLTADTANASSFAFVESQDRQGVRIRYQTRYEDELVKQDGRWQFHKRVVYKMFDALQVSPQAGRPHDAAPPLPQASQPVMTAD